jgi:hypothetical protein
LFSLLLTGLSFGFLGAELQALLSSPALAVQFLLPFDLLVLAHDTSFKGNSIIVSTSENQIFRTAPKPQGESGGCPLIRAVFPPYRSGGGRPDGLLSLTPERAGAAKAAGSPGIRYGGRIAQNLRDGKADQLDLPGTDLR